MISFGEPPQSSVQPSPNASLDASSRRQAVLIARNRPMTDAHDSVYASHVYAAI
jgi:hypothetical protein